ncbi:uncharacterized protein LOC131830133 [Mustela lutreola]|uniref:uncharacterized protein LOC131830133 n=1 Tax=Mustela lutreola TaxID=9666 RepID=UPI002797740F|nr:uncharacterized protein LOC131830133 [Mustela lutreola]
MLVTNSGYRDEIQTQLPFSGLASKIWSKDQDKGLAPGSRSEYLRQQSLSSADWAETLQLVSQEKLMGYTGEENLERGLDSPLKGRRTILALAARSRVLAPRRHLSAAPSVCASASPPSPPRSSVPGHQLLAAPTPAPRCSIRQQWCVPAFSSRLVLHPPPAPPRHRAAPSLCASASPPSPSSSVPASSSSPPRAAPSLCASASPPSPPRSSVPGLQLLAAPCRAAPSLNRGASPPSPPGWSFIRLQLLAAAAPLPPSTDVSPRLLLPASHFPAFRSSPLPRCFLPLRMCIPAFSSPLDRYRPPAPRRCAVSSLCACASPPSPPGFFFPGLQPLLQNLLWLPGSRGEGVRALSPPLRAENEHIPGRVPGWQEEWVWSLGQPSKMGQVVLRGSGDMASWAASKASGLCLFSADGSAARPGV